MDDYHVWLCDILRADLPEHRRYKRLLRDLDEKEFICVHPLDKNRLADGLELRYEYIDRYGVDISGPVSCLEVLTALSRRIEIEIMGEPGNDRYERWFWIMIRNLELDEFTDDNYDQGFVDEKLEIWLQRRFKKNGKGSIFPTYKTDIDQRDIDIWYQMQGFLMENYPI